MTPAASSSCRWMAPHGRSRARRPGFADGSGADARFRRLSSVAVAAPGRLIVADAGQRAGPAGRRTVAGRVAAAGIAADRSALRCRRLRIAPVAVAARAAWRGRTRSRALSARRGAARAASAFMQGIDVRAAEGTPVRAVRDGLVSAPLAAAEFGALSESLRHRPGHIRAPARWPAEKRTGARRIAIRGLV